MNCQDCVFSTRKQNINWCSFSKDQKEITKDTLICQNFVKRSNPVPSIVQLNLTEDTSPPKPPKLSSDLNSSVSHNKQEISHLDRRELAFEAEKAMKRLMERSDIQGELSTIQAFLQPIFENEREKSFKEKLHITTSYKNFVPSKEISKIVHVLNNSIHHYQSAQEDIKKYQRGQQDILHAFELTDLSDEQLMTYTKELQTIRLYRRQAKNFVETLEPLYQFSLKNKSLLENLKKVNSEIDKIRTNIKTRMYYVREDTTLKKAFEEAQPLHKRMNEVVV